MKSSDALKDRAERPLRPLRPFAVHLVYVALVALGIWWLSRAELALPLKLHNESPAGIVLVVIDALRPDHLSCYGYRRPTPNIDAIASEGVLFETAYTNGGWTRPAVVSLLTGLWPSETGTAALMSSAPDGTSRETAFPSGVDTLAEVLSKNDYVCGGFVSNLNVAPELGFGRGFAVYRQVGWNSESLLAASSQWLAGLPEKSRFFVYMHFLEPHAPYGTSEQPPGSVEGLTEGFVAAVLDNGADYRQFAAWRDEVIRGKRGLSDADVRLMLDRYDADIARSDRAVGDLSGMLKSMGIFDQTLIVITADHGENFFEHGVIEHPVTGLYEEQLRIPLIIKFPASWGLAARKVAGTVQTADVTATISAACGARLGRGVDLAEYAALGTVPDRTIVCESGNRFAVISAGIASHYVNGPDGAVITGMYRTGSDSKESVNILDKRPSHAARLTRRVNGWRSFVTARAGTIRTAVDMSRERREQLRTLGYLR